MVRVALAPHPLLLVTVVVAVYAAIPHAVMAIDLSRLYGHLSSKRNGKLTCTAPSTSQVSSAMSCRSTPIDMFFLLLHIICKAMHPLFVRGRRAISARSRHENLLHRWGIPSFPYVPLLESLSVKRFLFFLVAYFTVYTLFINTYI